MHVAESRTRSIILDILMRVTKDDEKSNVAIRDALDKNMDLSKQERAFIHEAAEGTIRRLIELDYIIGRFSTVPVEKMKPVIRNILRSAVYEIRYMDSVPDAAACDEAVKLTQLRGFYSLKGFVNGVLRAVVRGVADLPYPSEKNPMEYLSVRYSMPRWIVKLWADEFGLEKTEKILDALLRKRPLTVRLPEDPDKRKEALESLAQQGVSAAPSAYLPYAYDLSDVRLLPALTAFRNGWIYPQDAGAMLVAEAAAPTPGDYVIDVCAAPGGKSLHIADKMRGYGMVEARDLTEDKIAKIRENIQRCDTINVRAVQKDATVFDEASEGKADIVICDVPCSGLGVIARKPDIKYRANLENIEELAQLQRDILVTASRYVKNGGTLIYSTCTVGHIENIDNVRYFLTRCKEFRADPLDPFLPKELARESLAEGYLSLLPGIDKTDGFFLARFKKEAAE